MVQFGDRVGTKQGSSWDIVETVLAVLGWLVWGSIWDRAAITLGSCWEKLGIVLGTCPCMRFIYLLICLLGDPPSTTTPLPIGRCPALGISSIFTDLRLISFPYILAHQGGLQGADEWTLPKLLRPCLHSVSELFIRFSLHSSSPRGGARSR